MTIHREPDGEREHQMLLAGVESLDITPSDPVAMSGFAARTEPSSGTHDPLSVRALVVDRTALITVDVVGLHEDLCARVRASVRRWVDHAIIHATHTHSGPTSMPGRLGTGLDEDWLTHVESSCVEAVRRAAMSREPVVVSAGYGDDPNIGRNRRRPGGPVDDALPVLRLSRPDSTNLALLVSYACHPVVLSAQNSLLSADYPGVVRRRLEASTGATALFVTSCAGDINTGHALDGRPADLRHRTFARCEDIGRRIADAALRSAPTPGVQLVDAAHQAVAIPLEQSSPNNPACRADLRADTPPDAASSTWEARVSAFRWGPAVIVALPGEPFSQASLDIRRQLSSIAGAEIVAVLGYSDGCPGYFPACDEYALGGYEVEQAHHYYGMPSPFARGSLELLAQTAVTVARSLRTPNTPSTDEQQHRHERRISAHP